MNQLEKIGLEMRGALEGVTKGFLHRVLFGGLHLLYERRFDTWRLAIARENKPPSAKERDVVARDFKVPAGTEWSWTQRAMKGGNGAKVTMRICECQWIEAHAPARKEINGV